MVQLLMNEVEMIDLKQLSQTLPHSMQTFCIF